MVVHDLKCWPDEYTAIAHGEKGFEFRWDDRGYAVGDILALRCWCPHTERYLFDAVVDRQVTYVLRGPDFGVPPGYVVLSISPSIRRIGTMAETPRTTTDETGEVET